VRTITGMGALFSSASPKALAMRFLYRRLQRRAARDCQVTVFQNPDDRQYFLDRELVPAGTDRLVLSSGIDVEPYVASAGDPAARATLRDELGLGDGPVITMVSRLIRPKGIAEYLEAASLVRARDPRITFLLIGPEVHEGPTAFPVDRVHGCPDVRYLGRRADVPTLLAISDLFVLPSYLREGVPRVLLEAGALGLPLVTTDAPGCREVVRHGENGVLVPARDGQALASTVFDLLADPARRRRMGHASRELVTETFHLDIVAAAYARIYRRALGVGESRDTEPLRRAA
jgi:glycosyltransferase involved in cell wall biosynthesis